MNDNKFNIAVLIDGDNAQAKLINEIIEEVSKYGKATIRRIYGDWTNSHMNSWKEALNKNSISPIQKFSYTTGKNSTDSSLIIDAMDILHGHTVEGFCIVSSDSDYTGLAKRIREQGLFVMGIGKSTTPVAFVNSCEIFTFTENLLPEEEMATTSIRIEKKKTVSKSKKQKEIPIVITNQLNTNNAPQNKKTKLNMSQLDKAFEISAGEDEEAYISTVGNALRKIDPSFDPRTYGFKSLTQLFQSIPKYQIVRNEMNGLSYPILKLR
ncbi:MAG: Maebl [Pseudopedobacter saltans]|uniref:Maebl n=1 Tax=Pseudopedobacter saltans TaxID=151895 RepID=A0A2W5F902_9SPHI|nr:MAG: Maebl [Pseudopedobacter saltans]